MGWAEMVCWFVSSARLSGWLFRFGLIASNSVWVVGLWREGKVGHELGNQKKVGSNEKRF